MTESQREDWQQPPLDRSLEAWDDWDESASEAWEDIAENDFDDPEPDWDDLEYDGEDY